MVPEKKRWKFFPKAVPAKTTSIAGFADVLLPSQGGSLRRILVIFALRRQNHFVMNGLGPSFRCLKMRKPMNCGGCFDYDQQL